MVEYYYLIAELPNLIFDGGKPPFTISMFKDKLAPILTKKDKRLLELLFLKVDNKNLLEQLRNPGYELIPDGKYTIEELEVLISGFRKEIESRKKWEEDKKEYKKAKEERENQKKEDWKKYKEELRALEPYPLDRPSPPPPPPPLPPPPSRPSRFKNKNKRLPAYFITFTKMYFESVVYEKETTIPWEDLLSSLYYEYAIKRSNSFVALWFELNLDINNIYTALTCRKYKLDRANYIVGNTETSNKLRTSTDRDFELGESLPYLTSVFQIAEDTDIRQREWRTDQLKWEWLDEQIFIKVFGSEAILTYMLKIEMMERWANFDKVAGENVLRQMAGTMKKGGNNTLEEFKRNNKK
jgi:hypothetical protein